MSTRFEPFKDSPKSLCGSCSNIKEDCFHVQKSCGTDAKLGKSFVSSCCGFNKPIVKQEDDIWIEKGMAGGFGAFGDV